MSTKRTENYQLHAWEPGDDFLLAEINENFAALDDGVRMATGTYEGVSSKTNEDIVSSIDLGFTPKAVLVFNNWGMTGYERTTFGGLALPGAWVGDSGHFAVKITEGGFQVRSGSGGSTNSMSANSVYYSYHYIALR